MAVTFAGREVAKTATLWEFNEGSCFLLAREEDLTKDLVKKHKGFLWQCLDCQKASTRKQNLLRKKERCKHSRFWFQQDNRSMVDQAPARLTKPQYCPKGHCGPSRELDPSPPPTPQPAAKPPQALTSQTPGPRAVSDSGQLNILDFNELLPVNQVSSQALIQTPHRRGGSLIPKIPLSNPEESNIVSTFLWFRLRC